MSYAARMTSALRRLGLVLALAPAITIALAAAEVAAGWRVARA